MPENILKTCRFGSTCTNLRRHSFLPNNLTSGENSNWGTYWQNLVDDITTKVITIYKRAIRTTCINPGDALPAQPSPKMQLPQCSRALGHVASTRKAGIYFSLAILGRGPSQGGLCGLQTCCYGHHTCISILRLRHLLTYIFNIYFAPTPPNLKVQPPKPVSLNNITFNSIVKDWAPKTVWLSNMKFGRYVYYMETFQKVIWRSHMRQDTRRQLYFQGYF